MSQVLSLQPDELGPADTTRFSWLCRKRVFYSWVSLLPCLLQFQLWKTEYRTLFSLFVDISSVLNRSSFLVPLRTSLAEADGTHFICVVQKSQMIDEMLSFYVSVRDGKKDHKKSELTKKVDNHGGVLGSIKPANTKKTCLHHLKHLSFLHFILFSRLYSPHQPILNPETSPSYIKCTNGQIVGSKVS